MSEVHLRCHECGADVPFPAAVPAPPAPGRRRVTILASVATAALMLLASTCSILGQGVSYRQMRAMERVSDSLARCHPGAP